MKTACAIFALLLLTAHLSAHAQNFTNLNFEAANVAGHSPGTFGIPTTNALPGWTAYEGNVSGEITNIDSQVWYNGKSLGGQMISINDTNRGFGFVPLQGKFSASLNGITTGAPPPNDYFAAIGQIGQIPLNTESITFYGTTDVTPFGFKLTFAGQLIPLVQIGSTPGYNIYGGDVSAFAGQSSELLFTALPGHGGILDNIQFSPSPVPEPTALALLACGGLIFRAARRRSRCVPMS